MGRESAGYLIQLLRKTERRVHWRILELHPLGLCVLCGLRIVLDFFVIFGEFAFKVEISNPACLLEFLELLSVHK